MDSNPTHSGRQRLLLLVAPLAAGLALRLFFIFRFGQTTFDTRVYGQFARNLLEHGVYGYNNIVRGVSLAPIPTLIRLPGYPLFLAACFKLFGPENYRAVMLVQALVDLWTCLLLASLAARLFGQRTGRAALWLAALCPFTANYVAAPLTETLTLWCIALAFYALARWQRAAAPSNGWLYALACALGYAILLRPEQGLLAASAVPAVALIAFQRGGLALAVRKALLLSLLTVLPLVPWTVRNFRVFHVFQPLAPRFATDPGERINYGFQRWYRSWAVEFVSTGNVYWNYDGQPIALDDLPSRAFNSQLDFATTAAILSDYDDSYQPSDAIDARFDALARDRIRAHPVRFYLVLPVARVLNMALRPRTEMLPVPGEWWKFKPGERLADSFALGYAGLNLLFFALSAPIAFSPRRWGRGRIVVAAMLATIAMRVALLLTIDNSEPRYTLEFYPILIVLAAATLAAATGAPTVARSSPIPASQEDNTPGSPLL